MKTLISLFSIVLCLSYGKAQWVELDPGVDVPYFSDVYAITPDIVVVVGANGTIIKTTDGGETWTQKPSGTDRNLNMVQFPTPEIGYIVSYGYPGIMLKTTDGGETWFEIEGFTVEIIEGLSCLNENVIYVSGWWDKIAKSTDGGESWETIYNVNDVKEIQFLTESVGYVARYPIYGPIKKTVNGGQSWHELIFSHSPFHFLNENIGFYYFNGLYKTIDGGDNFTKVTEPEQWALSNLFVLDEKTIWGIHSSNDGVVKITSPDSGTYSEVNFYYPEPTVYLNSIKFTNENIGYMVGSRNYGDSGVIWKNSTGINVMGTNEIEEVNKIKVYPNPASEEINILFEKAFSGVVSLYDLTGKQVYSTDLANKNNAVINVEKFTKGIYILLIKARGKTHTQKLIVN